MLKLGGILNFVLAAGHLIAMIWLDKVFKIWGIDEQMGELSGIHPSLPYIITICVALGLFVFGLYAFSANGNIRKLSFLKLGVFGIAALFIFRALAGVMEILFTDVHSSSLEIGNSLVSLLIGVLYLAGGLKKWVLKKTDN